MVALARIIHFAAFLHLNCRIICRGDRPISNPIEYALRKHILKNYSKETRPIQYVKDPTKVYFECAIAQIISMDIKEESFSVSLFLRQRWKDPFLAWDPKDFGNVTVTTLPSSEVWVPDIVLKNSADRESGIFGNLDQLTRRVIVNHTGAVLWLSYTILTSQCPMDIRAFPFDVQNCVLRFTSWTYNGDAMELRSSRADADMGAYSPHTEWKIVSTKFVNTLRNGYYEINLEVNMRRHPLFYTLNLIIPIILITVLAAMSFYVPSESGRLSYGVTMVLAMTLFMMLLSNLIPAASDSLSRLGLLFNILIFEMTLMIFLMCYVSIMYCKTAADGAISNWMRVLIFNNFSYKLGVRNASSKTEYLYQLMLSDAKPVGADGEEFSIPFSFESSRHGSIVQDSKNGKKISSFINTEKDRTAQSEITDNIIKMLKWKNKKLFEEVKSEKEDNFFLYEWKICAMTVDVMCLMLFVGLFIVTGLAIIFNFMYSV